MQAAKRGPELRRPPPASRPAVAHAHARTRQAHPPTLRGSAGVPAHKTPARIQAHPSRARAHTPLGPAARTYPATRRAHRGPRTAAASCQTWSPPGLRAAHGAAGWRPRRRVLEPSPRAVDGSSRTEESSRGRTGARRRSDSQQWRPGPLPSQLPQTLSRRPRRLRASRGNSVASSPSGSALAFPGYWLSRSRSPLQQAGRADSCFKDEDR